MPRALLSVDPGTSAAWVLWREVAEGRWAPLRVGREKAPSTRSCLALLGQLGLGGPSDTLVVEGQFYTPKRGFSPWTDVATLIELRAWWMAAADLLGVAVEVVPPGTWIPVMTKGAPGATTKDRLRWVCGVLLPWVPLAADEHDAAALGVWWIKRAGGRVVQAPAHEKEAS